jgi:NAD(P)H-quinone oxidoreductase subunit 5
MSQLYPLWPSQNASLLCVPSVLFFLGGIVGRLASYRRLPIQKAWRTTLFASSTTLLFALVCCADALIHATAVEHAPQIDSLFRSGAFTLSFRFDSVSVLMLLLVTFLGWIITNYSRAYMSGDAEEARYIGNLMWTLGAVSLLVVTNNLVLFLAAWVLTSLTLHGLLTLYPYRQAAVIAAHKKFLASRLGDLTLLGAVVILGSQTGSFEMDEVVRRIAGSDALPTSIHVAAILLAASAMIKCAQLPLHGWLIQVMEAPTPVSALLHAGVVNLGGFMLIRLASVINTTPAAQTLLVVSGCLTAIISSMVMTTRISIKVHLAWSTCAQMGFMLTECGLGLYSLALLHLLAHSLYKAHAFLGSGGAVKQATLKRMTPALPESRGAIVVVSAFLGILVAALGSVIWASDHHLTAAFLFGITIVSLAIAGTLAALVSARDFVTSLLLALSVCGVSVIYFGYEALFQKLLPNSGPRLAPPFAVAIFVLIGFALLYLTQAIVRKDPSGQLARVLYPWFYAGFYMDELFTRVTFRIWPTQQATRVLQRRDALQPFTAKGASK